MDKLNKSIRAKLFIAILFTVFLPAGILSIIFGAIKGLTFLLVAGIIMTVLGFYGTPIIWVNYAEQKKLRVVLRLIVNENIFSVEELSAQLLMNQKNVTSYINSLIVKGYLTGFLFKDGVLKPNTNKKQAQAPKVKRKMKCEQCGGVMVFDGAQFVCEYCGHIEQVKE